MKWVRGPRRVVVRQTDNPQWLILVCPASLFSLSGLTTLTDLQSHLQVQVPLLNVSWEQDGSDLCSHLNEIAGKI
jgi:hypothetical protein